MAAPVAPNPDWAVKNGVDCHPYFDWRVPADECEDVKREAEQRVQKQTEEQRQAAEFQRVKDRCNDPELLDSVRRGIAERMLNEAILHTQWLHTGYRPSSQTLLCYGILPMVGSVNYGWKTFEGQTYVVWELHPA
jgi:hypothetical protein